MAKNKQNMVYLWIIMLFRDKNVAVSDAYSNVSEYQSVQAKYKKSSLTAYYMILSTWNSRKDKIILIKIHQSLSGERLKKGIRIFEVTEVFKNIILLIIACLHKSIKLF
jgi:hypothetical protein